MMRVFRAAVVIIFVLVTAVFSAFYIKEQKSRDDTLPEIKVETDTIEVSVKDGPEILLEGVSAYDGKDGDLTDKVIVESVSKFIEKGVSKVTYAVCDSNNHVTNATRRVIYKDYESPRFNLTKSTCYSTYETVDIKDSIEIEDCFDGSLKNNLIVSSQNYTSATEGVFTVEAEATNSRGDTVKIKLPLIVEDRSLTAPQIYLKHYLLYLDVGEKTDLKKNVLSVVDYKDQDLKSEIKIDSDVNFNKKGVYTVHYYATDDRGDRGHSVMTVIVGS